MTDILVLANETIGGKNLLDTVLRRRDETGGDVRFHVVVPQTRPRHGNVIYDDAVRDSAQVRVDLALAFMQDEGIEGTGEVGDADPYNAALDAIGERHIDELLVSTLPASASGWLRRDLIDRLREGTGLPVEHVVVDLAAEGLPFDVTLVVANQTVASAELRDHLRKLADEGPHRFIVVVPLDSKEGNATREARSRLEQLVASLDDAGIVAAGHDRRPRSLHGDDERGPVLPDLRRRHLDAARGRVPLGGRQARRPRPRAANVPVEHIQSHATANA